VNQNVASVNILIFTGANLEISDADGNTPLMIGI
jgi:ankyrin repeat protein